MSRPRYNTIIFFASRPPVKYRNVTNLYRLMQFVTYKISNEWTALNIYDAQSKQFIKQLRPNNYIPVNLL